MHFTVHCVILVPVTSPLEGRLVSQSQVRGFNGKPRKEQRPKISRGPISPVHQTHFNSHQCLGEGSSSVLISEKCSYCCASANRLTKPAGLCVIELRWWKAEADADRRSEIYNEQKDVKRAKSSASGTFATAFLTARQTNEH